MFVPPENEKNQQNPLKNRPVTPLKFLPYIGAECVCQFVHHTSVFHQAITLDTFSTVASKAKPCYEELIQKPQFFACHQAVVSIIAPRKYLQSRYFQVKVKIHLMIQEP